MDDILGNAMGIAPGRTIRVYEAYIEAKKQADAGLLDAEEAMSTSDFPTYMSALIRHRFLTRFSELQGVWTQYTKDFSLEDFEEWTSSRFGRFADISQKALNAPYEQLAIKEFPAEKLRLKEWGNGFSLTRQLILADRLGEIARLPNLLAEALARTMSKRCAVTMFEGNPTMYDGEALFSAAHGNIKTTALTANITGVQTVQAADLLFDDMTDDEGYKIVTPGNRTMIIPTEYRWIAKALQQNQLIPNAGGTALDANLIAGTFDILMEPFFSDDDSWYLAADLKGDMAFMAHITLNGNTTPFVGLKDPAVRAVMGGNDPYSFEFDEVEYKLRHDFEFKPIEWRGIIGSVVS